METRIVPTLLLYQVGRGGRGVTEGQSGVLKVTQQKGRKRPLPDYGSVFFDVSQMSFYFPPRGDGWVQPTQDFHTGDRRLCPV